MSFRKVLKENFGAGTISLYIRLDEVSSTTNIVSHDREIEGRLSLNIMIPTFVKGIWIKLLGSAATTNPENDKSTCFNLFKDSEEFYLDGLHEVLIGFGEEDNNYGSFIDVKPGRYQYPFLFKLPFNTPASFYDTNVSISYKVVVTLDSPAVSTISNKLNMESEVIIQYYSKLNCLKLSDDAALQRSILKIGNSLHKQIAERKSYFPNILNMIRTPIQLNAVLKSINNNENTASSLFNSSWFHFENKNLSLEFECNVQNVKHKSTTALVVRCDLYSELCIKSSRCPIETFPPLSVIPNPIISNSKDDLYSINKISEYQKTITSEEFNNFPITFPIEINADAYFAASIKNNNNERFLSQCYNNSENKGKILHYTIENPLFRLRFMFKMAIFKENQIGEQPNELASVFSEIYITPPFFEIPNNNNPAVKSNNVAHIPRPSISVPPLAIMPVTTRIIPTRSVITVDCNQSSSSSSRQPESRLDTLTVSSRAPLQDRHVLTAASRPPSGSRNSRTAGGGVATFRSQHNNIHSLEAENVYNHINILPQTSCNNNKTPHAKQTKSKSMIQVQAELLSRGPAAAVIDRQDRSIPNNIITTPQRFAMMYEICSASVIDGSPIVCASTPVALSTVDFNRIREQNINCEPIHYSLTNTPMNRDNTSVTVHDRGTESQYDAVDYFLSTASNSNSHLQSQSDNYIASSYPTNIPILSTFSDSSLTSAENVSRELNIIL